MTKTHYRRDSCRLCKSKDVRLGVRMVDCPIGGAFVKDKDTEQELFPLNLYQCGNCGHVQLLDVINPDVLFKDYTYFSGKTSLIKHFKDYSSEIMSRFSFNEKSLIVDIGSNDGGFLRFFKDAGMRILGVDPAINVAEFATKNGVPTLAKMFDASCALGIINDYGKADLVSANNVFAHIDNLEGVARAVETLLSDEGVFCFEVSYLRNVVDKMLFGTIFHEHLSYHSIKPLKQFLTRCGLTLFDVKEVPIQGGSIICFAQKMGGPHEISSTIDEMISKEEQMGMYNPIYLDSFSQRINNKRKDVNSMLSEISKDSTIAAYGAARGGTLLTYIFDLGDMIEFIVDDDQAKQGYYSPGHHIPVVPTSQIQERNPDYIVILAWVHSKSIIENNQEYLKSGGRFITFFPEIAIIGSQSS